MANRLALLPGVRAMATMPGQVPAGDTTVIVVSPGVPYITYPEGRGLPGSSKRSIVRLRVLVIPGGSDMRTQQDIIDRHLSIGTGQISSVRTILQADQSLGGTACVINVNTAEVVVITSAGIDHIAGQLDIELEVLSQ